MSAQQEAIAKVLEGFDRGVFVRDTSGDGAPGWSLKLLPYVAALATLRESVAAPRMEDAPHEP